MTINQLETLTEDEVGMMLHILNVIDPIQYPKFEFKPQNLLWFKHPMLIRKLLNAFPRVLPEGHATYQSLMNKLGVEGEIRYETPPTVVPIPSPAAETGSIEQSTTGSL